jgi:hypothetical protein
MRSSPPRQFDLSEMNQYNRFQTNDPAAIHMTAGGRPKAHVQYQEQIGLGNFKNSRSSYHPPEERRIQLGNDVLGISHQQPSHSNYDTTPISKGRHNQ